MNSPQNQRKSWRIWKEQGSELLQGPRQKDVMERPSASSSFSVQNEELSLLSVFASLFSRVMSSVEEANWFNLSHVHLWLRDSRSCWAASPRPKGKISGTLHTADVPIMELLKRVVFWVIVRFPWVDHSPHTALLLMNCILLKSACLVIEVWL